MAAESSVPLWERPVLRAVAGDTLRPGGFALTDRAAEYIDVVPGWRVLDIGCGLGATVERLRSRYGAEAWGVESSSSQIRRVVSPMGLIQARGDSLPFQNTSFDALFCECVFSLFDDQPHGLDELHRVLKPGGFLVLTDLCAPDAVVSRSDSCAARAVPVSATRALVESGGFSVCLLEDHSRHLKELAAGLIFAGGENADRCVCDRRGLGYYLLVAQKREVTDA